ncbi:LysR family transcriptional regulator [Serinibacter arcticus]|uniref:LysR family transcriptional regulator n=1 Tax=Serinibacter arcticus TaxID=1655435 RepID=A0A2U1ZUQ1_9MICO|nr:RidA family protein [Serinibacter arcticus]PWD50716.1 LysR family transcriptional regulator [Serinibacter arcticus]
MSDVAADGSPSSRLAALGLELPPVATPVAAYIPAVRVGDLVHTSGQLPIRAGELLATGKVGAGEGLVAPDEAAELARVAALNALAAVADVTGGLDNIVRIVKVVGFVASDPSFSGQPLVINGASTLFGEVFGTAHARSAVGVTVLPLDSPVEVELIAQVR